MTIWTIAVRAATAAAFACTLCACASIEPVQPWEKGILAKAEMSFEGDRLEQSFGEHVYASREGASGGNGSSAGGCGCY